VQSVEIEPGRMAQVTRALKSGKLVAVDDDVQNVANDLHEIDPGLKLSYEPGEDVWIVKHVHLTPAAAWRSGSCRAFQECDQRIVQRVREINRPATTTLRSSTGWTGRRSAASDHEFSGEDRAARGEARVGAAPGPRPPRA
jgi:hypothetical protein